MAGWIKTYRKTLDNPIICKDADYLAVWIYLLLNATHQSQDKLFGGKRITLQPGQLITGRNVIASKFKINESKVQRILKCFENEQQIEQQTSNKNRLISILNWSEYQSREQDDEQQLNNNRTTTEQQLNTNKNDKNDKNERNNLNGADWKKDFNVYLSDLRTAFRDVQKNDKWLKQQQSFYPKVDIIKSIEKSCVNFWGTEAGWKHKKKSRYKSVDWNSTFANSISQNQNKVYKTAYDEQQDNIFTY